ncbi:hypothetical protein EJF36_14715 [Bacillus sp. HMF5848]|nr:hypothetical protein EJF36_14715 [Bacillus sp. HMF5848]
MLATNPTTARRNETPIIDSFPFLVKRSGRARTMGTSITTANNVKVMVCKITHSPLSLDVIMYKQRLPNSNKKRQTPTILYCIIKLSILKEGDVMLKSKISEQNGATLLEVLISFAILSILLLSSMNFFLQSYKYTTQNKDKTTAVYLAQNVMNYMQKQSFMKMEGYVTYQLTKNPNKPLVELSMSLCNSPVTVSPINPLNHNERVSDVDNVFLFDDTARCQAVLTPIINNKQYTNDDIKIYIMPSVEQSDLDDLLNTSPNLPSLLKENLEANQNVTNLSFRTSLLHVFILINSENRNKAVLLEGTIVDESIR